MAREPYSMVVCLQGKRDLWPMPFWMQPGHCFEHCLELEAATQVSRMWPLGTLDWPPGAG